MIRAILFDFGGTIDTDGIHWSEKFYDLYCRLNASIPKAGYEKAYVAAERKMAAQTIPAHTSLRAMLAQQVVFQCEYLVSMGLLNSKGESWKLAAEIGGVAYEDVTASIETVKPILGKLKSHYRLGLVSNFTGNLAKVTRELDIEEFFDVVIDSTVVGIAKPNPAIFSLAADEMGLRVAECAAVGDSYDRDIVPAKSIGMGTVFLHGRSWREPDETDKADFVIRSLQELPSIISRINPDPSGIPQRR